MTSKNDKRKKTLEQRKANKARQGTGIGKQQEIFSPTERQTFADLCRQIKGKVYSITRIRAIEGSSQANFITLGTGFLAGNGRMITCAHVMSNKDAEHQDGDKYLLIQKDEFGDYHRDVIELEKDKTLFIYENMDCAILYLPDSFYKQGDDYIKNPEDFLQLAGRNHPIGTEVGVFGYPLQSVRVNEDQLDMDDIYIRVDRGILNCGNVVDGVQVNEFTLAFNPGNSGGPIVDSETGKVIAFVESFTSRPIKFVKEPIPQHQQEDLGAEHAVTAIRALYSRGFCISNLKSIAAKHNLKIS